MKVGILTFHCAHNYGAVLQCYAMQEMLCREGHEVEIINYRPKYLTQPYVLFDKDRIINKKPVIMLKRIIIELLIFKYRYRRWRRFNSFINTHLLQGELVKSGNIPSDLDVYIVGSDQIWNANITSGVDDIYFCNFPFSKGNKKYIAYAASKGSSELTSSEIEYYKRNLLNFDFVSVREVDLQNMLQSFMKKNIKHVLDPTLMAPKLIWDKLSTNNIQHDKYVVVYQVRAHRKTIEIANHIANQIGAKVKILVAWLERNTSEMCQDVSPAGYVEMIRNAACVVTTSFHGTAFSIIFNRPFYTIKLNDGADSRAVSLLKSLDLEDRLISVEELPVFSTVDYDWPNEKLETLRRDSYDFLQQSIKNAI